jgi:hypothetical protein
MTLEKTLTSRFAVPALPRGDGYYLNGIHLDDKPTWATLKPKTPIGVPQEVFHLPGLV